MTVPVRCPACGGEKCSTLETIELAEQHSHYAADIGVQRQLTERAGVPGDTYRMLKCGACGLEFADPLQAPSSTWYDLVYGVLDLYPGKRWEFEHVLALLKPGEVLGEFGCGSGEFLQQCARAGVKASGVDFSAEAVRAGEKAGLDVRVLDVTGQVPEFLRSGDRDCVVAFQVLEHLDDPGSLFALASGWAKPSGRLFVAVPSDHRPSRLFGERDYLDQPPHHMSRWTERSMKAIGERHGWSLRGVMHSPLGFMARVWYASTRTRIYRAVERRGADANLRLKKVLRALLLPYGIVWALAFGSTLAGHAMLAEYGRKENPSP